MADAFVPTPPAGYHPYGRLSEIWERWVFIGLNVSLPFVYYSCLSAVLSGWPPSLDVAPTPWLVYAAVQVSGKLPISFSYPPISYFRRVIDAIAFIVLAGAVVAYALGIGQLVIRELWQLGFAAAVIGLANYWSAPRTRMADGQAIPMVREVYARCVGTLVNLPMYFALVALSVPPVPS